MPYPYQVVKNRGFSNFDAKDMAIDTAIGAIGGAIGGKGASYGNAKSAMSMGKQLVRRVSKTGEFKKALLYYGKSMRNGFAKSIYKEMGISFAKSGGYAFGTQLARFGYGRYKKG